MGANSKIAWTDHTFNPWIGCTKVSDGCLHCYAEREQDLRYGRVKWGKGQPRHRTSAAYWKQPLRWNAAAAGIDEKIAAAEHSRVGATPHRPRVFCASLADWLDDEVPIDWLADLLEMILHTPNLDWLLLTKRPQNWKSRLDAVLKLPRDAGDMALGWRIGKPPTNVWLGTTVEDQARADERIPRLLEIPARVRFLSCEPLLGRIEFQPFWLGGYESCNGYHPQQIHWVIIGGESGPQAREFNLEYADDIVRQCRSYAVAPFVKQFGARPITTNANLYDFPDEETMLQYGSAAASALIGLRDREGRDLTEWPEQFQVQEFPKVS